MATTFTDFEIQCEFPCGIEYVLASDVAAANATLEKLRDAVPECEPPREESILADIYAILYPTTETAP